MAEPTITLKLADDGSKWTNDLVFFAAHNAANILNGVGAKGAKRNMTAAQATVENKDIAVGYKMTSGGNLIATAREKSATRPVAAPSKGAV